MTARVASFARLPLLWKLLVPFLALIMLVGPAAAFLVVRDLSARAQLALDQELTRRVLEWRSRLQERELYLLEAANLAANLDGMAAAVQAADRGRAEGLLQSVLALKTDVTLLAVAGPDGQAVAGFSRVGPGAAPVAVDAADGGVRSVVAGVAGGAEASAGLVTSGGRAALAIAVPVCGPGGCQGAGAAVGTVALDAAAADAVGDRASDLGVAVYAPSGVLFARRGAVLPAAPALEDRGLVRQRRTVGGEDRVALFAPLEVQGRTLGTIAAVLPGDGAVGVTRATAARLVAVLLAAMAAVVGIGALVTRSILRQVRALHVTSQALGRGDLAARAPVVADDEIGDLGRVMNRMAEQLHASHETLERRVEERTEEIRRLLHERTEFFASLSHELRTPLAVIISQAKLRLGPAGRPGRGTEAWKAVEASALQLLALVNDILELARADAGRLEVELADVDVAEALAPLGPTIEGLAGMASVGLDVDVPPGLPLVRADEAHLRQSVLNLVDNATKYTPPGGRVSLAARPSGEHVEVVVADTGVGIPDDIGDRLFEPFFRLPGPPGRQPAASTGLGLALVQRLVQAQGGQVGYVSVPGEGSTFTIRLPRTTEGAETTGGGGGRRAPTYS